MCEITITKKAKVSLEIFCRTCDQSLDLKQDAKTGVVYAGPCKFCLSTSFREGREAGKRNPSRCRNTETGLQEFGL